MIVAAHQTMMGPQGGAAAQRCAVFASSYARANIGSWTTANQGSFTMACWVWLDAPPYPTGVGCVMTLQNQQTTIGAQLDAISGNARKFRSVFQNVAILGPTANEVGGNGEWHHYAISYNYATATFAGFVDGAKLITGTPNRWLNANAYLIMSICTNGSASSLMNCKVANANLYLRALSDADVSALAAGVDVIPADADHQWIFANDDFADTGTATTKWDLTATGTVTFEDA